MDTSKLKVLGEAAKYDICSSTAGTAKKISNAHMGNTVPSGICHSFTPDGRCVSMLKVLMTNECEKDCNYCPNRVQRDVPRTTFAPDELAKLFIGFYERNYIEGLFLSSGVRHGMSNTMDNMLKTVELLRYKYRFGGYIHLKILPGSGNDYIDQSLRLADRISINMEAPNENRLGHLSRTKDFKKDIITPIANIANLIGKHPGTTHTTQFMVGAAQESDKEIITSVNRLYTRYKLKRAYFSAFQPVMGTPFEGLSPAPQVRENRLYQSDFLMRFYEFRYEDFIFDDSGNLDLTLDPKLMYAVRNPQLFPIEINRAPYSELTKVPGIGPISARKIVEVRRQCLLRSPLELKSMGISLKRSQKFITINGRFYDNLSWILNPQKFQYEQLSFFKEASL